MSENKPHYHSFEGMRAVSKEELDERALKQAEGMVNAGFRSPEGLSNIAFVYDQQEIVVTVKPKKRGLFKRLVTAFLIWCAK